VKLTPEDHAKLQTKQLANIIRKLNSGKTLTAREEAILARSREQEEVANVSGNQSPATGYASTWEELADACNVDRRTLQNVRQRFTEDIYAEETLWARADGRKEIAWWIKFLDRKGVRGRGMNNPDASFVDERSLRLRERQLAVEKEEFKLAALKRTVLPVAEYQAALRTTICGFESALQQLVGRAGDSIALQARESMRAALGSLLTPRQFAKLNTILDTINLDASVIVALLDREIESVRSHLAAAEFFETPHLEDGGD
jgi:hypothetical protein